MELSKEFGVKNTNNCLLTKINKRQLTKQGICFHHPEANHFVGNDGELKLGRWWADVQPCTQS